MIFFDPHSREDILGPIAASVWDRYNNSRLLSLGRTKSTGGNSPVSKGVLQYLREHSEVFFFLDQDYLRAPARRAGQVLHELATYASQQSDDSNPDLIGPFMFLGETNRAPEILLEAAGVEFDPSRVVVVFAGTNPGNGPFHNLHGFSNGSRFGDHLRQILLPMSGTAISEYLTHLVDENRRDPVGLVREFQKCIKFYERTYRQISVEPADRHVVSIFPFIYAVAKSLAHWRIFPLTDEEILGIVNEVEENSLSYYLDIKGKRDIVMLMLNYILNNREEFMQLPNDNIDNGVLQRAAGFYTLDVDGNYDEFQFFPARLKAVIGAGLLPKVLRSCDDIGYLIRDVGSFLSKCQVRSGDDGRQYMYRLRRDIPSYQPQLLKNRF